MAPTRPRILRACSANRSRSQIRDATVSDPRYRLLGPRTRKLKSPRLRYLSKPASQSQIPTEFGPSANDGRPAHQIVWVPDCGRLRYESDDGLLGYTRGCGLRLPATAAGWSIVRRIVRQSRDYQPIGIRIEDQLHLADAAAVDDADAWRIIPGLSQLLTDGRAARGASPRHGNRSHLAERSGYSDRGRELA